MKKKSCIRVGVNYAADLTVKLSGRLVYRWIDVEVSGVGVEVDG